MKQKVFFSPFKGLSLKQKQTFLEGESSTLIVVKSYLKNRVKCSKT